MPDRVQRQSEHLFDLGALFEFSTVIDSSLDLRFILGHYLLTLMGKLLAVRGVVLLQREGQTYAVETVKGLPEDLIGTEVKVQKVPQRINAVDDGDARKLPWLSFFRGLGMDILIPLTAREKTLGIAGFGLSTVKTKLNSKEETYIKSLTNIAAAAIEKGIVITELSQVNRRLDRKFQELNTLFELSKEFNAVLDPDRLVKLLMFSIMGQIGASKYFICLQKDGAMKVVGSRMEHQINEELCAYFPSVTSPLIISEMPNTKKHLKQMLVDQGIQVLIPLQIQNQMRGIVGLGEKMRGETYIQTDLEFLSSLSNLAIIALENARLFHEAIEKQKMEDELLIAKEIQRGLLPANLPDIPAFDLAATNISSKQVGGDYYDVIPLGNSKFVLAIGDVSGKGTPASLLMANLQATIRALVPLGLSLSELTKRVNDLLTENTGSDRFITFWWAILDSETRILKYVSAGHNPPFLFRRSGHIERLDKGGIILGIMKTMIPYEEGEVLIEVGDVLVLFTDGVSEAMDAKGEEWGEEPLEEIGVNHLTESSGSILSRIVDAVKEHGKNTQQSDDITIVVAKSIA